MSELDYTKIDRPIEPAFCNECPEQWCEVLNWEEARADKAESQLTTERKKVERLVWALSDVTELYCKLINSGDAGFWNPEDDEAIKKAIELLSEIKGEK